MQPWFRPSRKADGEKPPARSNQPGGFKLSPRSAVLLLLAQDVALADAALQAAAHQPVPLIGIGVITVFTAAHRFFDGLIQ